MDLKTIHNWVDKKHIPPDAVFRTPGKHLRFRPALTLGWMARQGYTVPEEVHAQFGGLPTPAAPFVAQALIDCRAMVERLPALPERDDLEKLLSLLTRAGEADPSIAAEVEHLLTGPAS